MRTVYLFGLLLLLGLGALARPLSVAPAPEEREVLTLEHEILCARILHALELTPAQQTALHPILSAQVTDLIAAREAKAKAQPDVLAAMSGLRSAVLANNGVSDAVKEAVHRAEAPYKVIEDRLEKQGPLRAAQVWALLTTAQGARLRRLARNMDATDAAFVAGATARLSPRSNDPARTLGVLYRLYGLYGEEITKAVAIGTPIYTTWQQQPAAQRDAARAGVMARLLALPPTGILQAEPDPLAEHALTLAVLTQKTLHALDPTVPMPPAEGVEIPQVQATVADIRVLNLVNTLYLTPAQSQALLAMQNRARADYALLLVKRVDALRTALPALRQMRDAYAAGQSPVPALLDQVKTLDTQRAAITAEDARIDAGYLKELQGLLTENQVTMVANFVPCTVPVQSLTNPERVGQADNADGIEQALARLRAAPANRLEKGIVQLQNGITAHFEKKHYRKAQYQPVVDSVPGLVADIRAMDDTEFALKKKELAVSLAVPAHIATGKELDSRILTYLLAPNLTSLLQGRQAGSAI